MMSRSLKEFLAEQAERLESEQQKAAQCRDEWVAAVESLNQQVCAWIAASDPERILKTNQSQIVLREQGIGEYEIPGLVITLGTRIARLTPVARFALGPLPDTGVGRFLRTHGRVDFTNGLQTYSLYRQFIQPDQWLIVDQDEPFRLDPFRQESFESALQGLLE
jgi:hypothetical protein